MGPKTVNCRTVFVPASGHQPQVPASGPRVLSQTVCFITADSLQQIKRLSRGFVVSLVLISVMCVPFAVNSRLESDWSYEVSYFSREPIRSVHWPEVEGTIPVHMHKYRRQRHAVFCVVLSAVLGAVSDAIAVLFLRAAFCRGLSCACAQGVHACS